MSCSQITAFQPRATSLCFHRNLSREFPAKPLNFGVSSHRTQVLERSSLRFTPVSKPRRSSPVCSSKSGGANEDTPWKSLGKAFGDLTKRQSIEDVLKQQIEKKEFYEDRDDGGGPPGGGGGGGQGGSDGLSGPEDEGILNELVQVVLATLGFIFMYTYFITGAELLNLFKDYIRYLLKGVESNRLKSAMKKWRDFRIAITPVKIEEDPHWLEKAILRTETWYDCPKKDRIIYDQLWEEQQKALGIVTEKPKFEPKPNLKPREDFYDSDDDKDDDDDF